MHLSNTLHTKKCFGIVCVIVVCGCFRRILKWSTITTTKLPCWGPQGVPEKERLYNSVVRIIFISKGKMFCIVSRKKMFEEYNICLHTQTVCQWSFNFPPSFSFSGLLELHHHVALKPWCYPLPRRRKKNREKKHLPSPLELDFVFNEQPI